MLNSFINPEPTQPTKPKTICGKGLSVNMLDIWSSDDEDIQEKVDVWEGEKDLAVEHVAERVVAVKKELVTEEVKTEQRIESGKEEPKKEPPVQTVSSIW